MMQGTLTSTPKILLAVDLDDTLFDSTADIVKWIDSETFWYELFEEVHRITDSQDVELVFCIVTQKDEFDDLCEAAARKFRIWLEKFCPEFIFQKDDKTWCLCNHLGKLQYICITDSAYNTTYDSVPLNIPSPFIVTREAKWGSIYKLADYHHIALENCILIDDNPDVIKNAQNQNIQTIPLTAFYKADAQLFDNHAFVNQTLVEVKNKLIAHIHAACSRVTKSAHSSLDTQQKEKKIKLF